MYVMYTWIYSMYTHTYIYRNKISCAYWLLSVNCLLGSHYLNDGISHPRQISSLLNRILAPFTCHQENSSITTLRASLPTTIIILSDVFCWWIPTYLLPKRFSARGDQYFLCGDHLMRPKLNGNQCYLRTFLKVLQDLDIHTWYIHTCIIIIIIIIIQTTVVHVH